MFLFIFQRGEGIHSPPPLSYFLPIHDYLLFPVFYSRYIIQLGELSEYFTPATANIHNTHPILCLVIYCISIYLSIQFYVQLSFVYLSIFLSNLMSSYLLYIYLSNFMSSYLLYIYLSIYPILCLVIFCISIYLSILFYVQLSIVYLSIHLSNFM